MHNVASDTQSSHGAQSRDPLCIVRPFRIRAAADSQRGNRPHGTPDNASIVYIAGPRTESFVALPSIVSIARASGSGTRCGARGEFPGDVTLPFVELTLTLASCFQWHSFGQARLTIGHEGHEAGTIRVVGRRTAASPIPPFCFCSLSLRGSEAPV